MSSTTVNLGLTKPAQGEQYNIDGFHNPNMDIIDSAVGALQEATTPGAAVTITTTDTDNTKFAVQSAQGVKMGKLAQVDIRVRRTGPTISSGNVSNVAMFTLPVGWRPIISTGVTTTAFGGLISADISSGGVVTLDSVGIDWPTTSDISISALFLVP